MIRVPFQTDSRAGTMTLLSAYAQSAGLTIQLYRAKPKQLKPPTAYIEAIDEVATNFTLTTRQRTPSVRVRCVWRSDVDSGPAVDQRDRFVDGFLDWVADNYHAFGANTLVAGVSVSDDPDFTFDDGAEHFSTVLTLEGFAGT